MESNTVVIVCDNWKSELFKTMLTDEGYEFKVTTGDRLTRFEFERSKIDLNDLADFIAYMNKKITNGLN